MVRPLLAGPMHTQSIKDVPEYAKYGFGMPDGPVQRTQFFWLAGNAWSRTYVDRPSLLVRDTDAGDLYVIFCGPQKLAPYNSAGSSKYLADRYRRGQHSVLLHRPGYWDFYNDSSTPVNCRIIDAASIYFTHPSVRDIQGYDWTSASYRTAGMSPQDPGALCTSNAGGGILQDIGIKVTQTAVTVPATAGGILVLAANPKRVKAIIQNRSAEACDLFLALTAGTFGTGVVLENAGSDMEIDGYAPWTSEIWGVTGANTASVSVIEMAY